MTQEAQYFLTSLFIPGQKKCRCKRSRVFFTPKCAEGNSSCATEISCCRKDRGTTICLIGISNGLLYCIVSVHLYSASCSAHQSEALCLSHHKRISTPSRNTH